MKAFLCTGSALAGGSRWQQVAAVAPVALAVIFFKVLYVKGAPAIGLVSWEPVLGCTPLLPRGLQGKRKEGLSIWDGGPLLIPWLLLWDP